MTGRRALLQVVAVLWFLGCGGGDSTEPREGPVRVSMIGDSITSPVPFPVIFEPYPEQLARMLGDDFEIGNFGYAGSTLQNSTDLPYRELEVYSMAKEFEPDIVTIKLGTNDSTPDNWDPEGYENDYRMLIDELQALSSRPTVLLLRPVPIFGENNYGVQPEVVSDEQPPIINRLGEEYGLTVVDLYNPLLPHGDLFFDQVHPVEEGSTLIAEELVDPLMDTATAMGFRLNEDEE